MDSYEDIYSDTKILFFSEFGWNIEKLLSLWAI